MTFDEYAKQQAAIIAALAAVLYAILAPFSRMRLGAGLWTALLYGMYPRVEKARRQSAELARTFYDAQRAEFTGADERHDTYLANYKPEWFAQAMEHVREDISKPGASEATVVRTIQAAAKQVENGGRKTALRAVNTDPKVKGWARVATGAETCGWCMMLVSRGPVYGSQRKAGLKTGKVKAVELHRQIEEAQTDEGRKAAEENLLQLMDKWHDNCDCKVVPVFDLSNWTGRDHYLEQLALWKKVTKGKSGQEAVNAFRRAVESGEPGETRIPLAA